MKERLHVSFAAGSPSLMGHYVYRWHPPYQREEDIVLGRQEPQEYEEGHPGHLAD